MKLEDIKYLCSTTGNLTGLPIRIYKNKEEIFYYSLVEFVKDPINPYKDEILKLTNHVAYFTTPMFHYYGIINTNQYQIVIGPSTQLKDNKEQLKQLAFDCNVNHEDINKFIDAMDALIKMPLNSILQTLCSINFVLNKEKLSLADLTIYENEQAKISDQINKDEIEKNYDDLSNTISSTHNTFTLEETIMNFVSHGDVSALKEWTKSAPAVAPGILSSDALRQIKNTFIVTTTLVSRAAIKGGIDVNDALALSDAYIQKCELLLEADKITNLQFHMVLDYTERVEKIRIGKNPSKFFKDISNYVQKHLSEPVNVKKMAKELYFSRTHLATKFKKETGITLTDFIINEKINESKRLLRYSDKPISSIALYLGFSSQSHFSNAFRKYTNTSPAEYRKAHKK